MALMIEIGDRAAQGRACGNLGNVHYLLGNFSRAIHFHQERLKIGIHSFFNICHFMNTPGSTNFYRKLGGGGGLVSFIFGKLVAFQINKH